MTRLIDRPQHGHGAGIARFGQGFGDLAGGLVVLVLVKGSCFLKGGGNAGRCRGQKGE